MRFAQEISIFNPHAIEMAVVSLGTQITQTAEEIRLEAAQTLSNYSTTVQMNAAISTKANEITSEVSETYATIQSLNSNVTSLSSRITQNANSISSEVTNRQNADSSLSSRIQQTATGISFTLSGGGTGTNANKASLSMKYTKEDGSTISLESQTITFSGLVKFTDLSTSGSTTINGANIQTGTLSANKITTGTLSGDRINGGTITGSTISGGKLIATGSSDGDIVIGGGTINVPWIQFADGNHTAGSWTIDGSTAYDNWDNKRLINGYGIRVGDGSSAHAWSWFQTGVYFEYNTKFDQTPDWSSDIRKKNFVGYADADESQRFIMRLKPCKFTYKVDEKQEIHHGFIAQDAMTAVQDEWCLVSEDMEGFLGIKYIEIIADLVATVQAQDKRIKALEGV